MPGAGLFEAAFAAASVTATVSADIAISFNDVTIPVPLLLQHKHTALLECAIDCKTGNVQVSSLTAKQKQAHCRGFFRQVITGEPLCEVNPIQDCWLYSSVCSKDLQFC